jgi:hypothetical protein
LAFTENAGFQVAIQITAVERLGPKPRRVHYNLLNTGSVDVPPGLPVERFRRRPGALGRIPAGLPAPMGRGHVWLGAHFLTLEGSGTSTANAWQVQMFVDSLRRARRAPWTRTGGTGVSRPSLPRHRRGGRRRTESLLGATAAEPGDRRLDRFDCLDRTADDPGTGSPRTIHSRGAMALRQRRRPSHLRSHRDKRDV